MAVVPFPDPQNQPEDRGDDAEENELRGKMSFLEHLDEFRRRLIRSLIALVIGVAIAFFFINDIFDFVMVPLQGLLPEGNQLIYTEPTEAFINRLKIALMAGLIIAGPAITYQIWRFVAPGLYANEKRFAFPFVFFMTAGLLGGAWFSHYIVFPIMWRFFASFDDEFVQFAPRIAPTFSLYLRMMLGTALIFQMPTLVFALARMGVVSARWLLRHFKYAVLLNFVVAAIVTPSPDPLSQLLIAAPMCVLYLISILIAWGFGKRRRKDTDDAR